MTALLLLARQMHHIRGEELHDEDQDEGQGGGDGQGKGKWSQDCKVVETRYEDQDEGQGGVLPEVRRRADDQKAVRTNDEDQDAGQGRTVARVLLLNVGAAMRTKTRARAGMNKLRPLHDRLL
jgi:hypothetical protein